MKFATLSELWSALQKLRGKTLITFHSLGDIDAVASAIALKELVKNAEAASLDLIASDAKRALRETGFTMPPAGSLAGYSNIIFVDVSTPVLMADRLPEINKFGGQRILIDHHFHTDYLPANVSYVNEQRSSTCEIIWDLYKLAGKKPDSKIATLLLAGVVRDSAEFRSANTFTFETVSSLLRYSKKPFNAVLEITKGEPDHGQKINVLDAVRRAKILESKSHKVVAFTETRAFTIQVASALVQSGADFAIAINTNEGKSSAVKRETLLKPQVGALMDRVAKRYSGSGGGHTHVGGAQVRPSYSKLFLNAVAQEAAKELG